MSTRPAAARIAVLALLLAAVPSAHADLPCVFENLPCPFQTEGGAVGPGETRTVTGPAKLDEPIEVLAGGTLVLQGAQLFVSEALPGIIVHGGGTLRIIGSLVDTQDGEPGAYVVHVLSGGVFELRSSVLRNGQGVLVESDLVTLVDSAIVGGGQVGVQATNATLELTRMTVDAFVGVNATNGTYRVEGSRFSNATQAMRFVGSQVEVVNNVVTASRNGIHVEDSNFNIVANRMDDRADPAGRGSSIVQSVGVVEDNTYATWGTGIEVRDSVVDVLGNTLTGNVVYGLFAYNLTGEIRDNLLQSNALIGMYVERSPGVLIEDNIVKESAYWQLVVTYSPDAIVLGNVLSGGIFFTFGAGSSPNLLVEDNVLTGAIGNTLYVQDAENVIVRRNSVTGGGVGLHVQGLSALVEDNTVSGTLTAGFDVNAYGAEGDIVVRRGISQAGNGVGFRMYGPVTGEDLVATRNALGLSLTSSSSGNLTLTRVNASENRVGLEARGSGPVTVADLRAFDNERDGVRAHDNRTLLDIRGARIAGHDEGYAVNATVSVHHADYAANAIAGVVTHVDARFSWWGHESGPRHSGNPSGLGDAVTDGVDYSSWITTRPTA